MILVTGATGLIGSHLIYRLLQQNKKVVALKRENSDLKKIKKIFSFYTNNVEELFAKIEWRNADILELYELQKAFEGIEMVYHCAAMVSFDSKMKKQIIDNNVNGTANVVNTALEFKIKKLCHVSSIASLGSKTSDNINETTERDFSLKYSSYSESKYNSELEVWRGIEEGLNAVIVNPSVVLGPGDWQNGSPSIFYNVWKGMSFYTNGITGYVDVNDVVNIMIELMKSNITSERFILNAEDLSFKEIFTKMAISLEKKPPKYNANKLLLNLAWRLDKLKSYLPRQKSTLTKEAASSANQISRYSNQKVVNTINYKFQDIDETIKNVSQILKKDFANNM